MVRWASRGARRAWRANTRAKRGRVRERRPGTRRRGLDRVIVNVTGHEKPRPRAPGREGGWGYSKSATRAVALTAGSRRPGPLGARASSHWRNWLALPPAPCSATRAAKIPAAFG